MVSKSWFKFWKQKNTLRVEAMHSRHSQYIPFRSTCAQPCRVMANPSSHWGLSASVACGYLQHWQGPAPWFWSFRWLFALGSPPRAGEKSWCSGTSHIAKSQSYIILNDHEANYPRGLEELDEVTELAQPELVGTHGVRRIPITGRTQAEAHKLSKPDANTYSII